MHGLILCPHPVKKLETEVPSLPASLRAKNIECKFSKWFGVCQPNTIWQAESMLSFRNDVSRQKVCHGLLEQVTETRSANFQTGRNSSSKFSQRGIQQRKPRHHTRQARHHHDLA